MCHIFLRFDKPWSDAGWHPDHKTIADFRKDNGPAIRLVCARFVELFRRLGPPAEASVAIDGSRFKAVNNRDRNFTAAKMKRRMAQIEESVGRYLHQLNSSDRQEPSTALTLRTTRLKGKIAKLKEEMGRLEALDAERQERPDQQISLTDPDARSMATSGRGSGTVGYNVQAAVDSEYHLIVFHEVTNGFRGSRCEEKIYFRRQSVEKGQKSPRVDGSQLFV